MKKQRSVSQTTLFRGSVLVRVRGAGIWKGGAGISCLLARYPTRQ